MSWYGPHISRADLQYLADVVRSRGTAVPEFHRQLLDEPRSVRLHHGMQLTRIPNYPSEGAIRAGQVEAAFKAAHPDCESEAWITGGYLTQMVCKLHRPVATRL